MFEVDAYIHTLKRVSARFRAALHHPIDVHVCGVLSHAQFETVYVECGGGEKDVCGCELADKGECVWAGDCVFSFDRLTRALGK
jgi:hypothetical protein